MVRSAFLDAGVMFGFCFITDDHHIPCRDYLDGSKKDHYIGGWRDEVFDRKKDNLVNKYSDGVLDHVANLTRSDYEGRLDLLDIKEIKSEFINRSNEAHQFLWSYYNDIDDEIILIDLQDRLRDLAHDIEASSLQRKEEFEELVDIWRRREDYPDVESDLAKIPTEDRNVCIDGHDLALHKEGHTEMATTDRMHFKHDGNEELILNCTEIDELVFLAI